ncbi:MAG: hypothetical protein NT062_08825 [Proteobacteria bacterium]|nr:hypothetical protein [Pseudomonadota bacterium]
MTAALSTRDDAPIQQPQPTSPSTAPHAAAAASSLHANAVIDEVTEDNGAYLPIHYRHYQMLLHLSPEERDLASELLPCWQQPRCPPQINAAQIRRSYDELALVAIDPG